MHTRINQAAFGSFAVSAIAGLSACAVATPPAIQNTAAAPTNISSVAFPEQEKPTTLRGQWAGALRQAFKGHAVKQQDDAAFIADYAVSVRPTETGLANVQTDVETSDRQTSWASHARGRGFIEKTLGECRALRVRGTLVIYEREGGAIAYRGISEAERCAVDRKVLGSMANQLVAQVVR